MLTAVRHDTKSRIFDMALRLFSTSGVENVSMRDIAQAVGIKAASIYNHYVNKEQIVEACYDFFIQYHSIGRLDKGQYTRVLREGTQEEIANIPYNQFPPDQAENLVCAMSVLYSRIYTDQKAIDLYTKMVDSSLQFLQEFFKTGIEVGRFEAFNVRGVSMLYMSARLFSAQSVTIHPDAFDDWDLAQKEMITVLIRALPFIY